jgi:DNA-binding NarL/FixJ family response regulator
MAESADTINIVIADEYKFVRESLKMVLNEEKNIQIIGEAANCNEISDAIEKLKPDIILLNILVLDMDSDYGISSIREKNNDIKLLILSYDIDEDMIFRALKAGARGYISYNTSISTLAKAIDVVNRGELWVERRLISRFFEEQFDSDESESHIKNKAPENCLTAREQEVLSCLTKGCTNKEIAEELFISEKTVKSHLNSIFRKLNVTKRLEATLYALKKGLA